MLSFVKTKTNKPIAIINKGKHNGTIVYLDSDTKNQIEYVPNNKALNEKLNRELTIKDGEFFMYPDLDTPDALYISGPRGSGKSTYISKYLKQYQKLHKKNHIYLFTDPECTEEDDAFKGIKIKKIPIDNRLIDEPIKLTELSDSLVIFDDIDNIEDKELEAKVLHLQKSILKYGRKMGISCLSSRHKTCEYQKTATLLGEASSLILYPKSGALHDIQRALKDYCGLNKAQMDKILSLDSRWIQLHKQYPIYCISEHKIMLL